MSNGSGLFGDQSPDKPHLVSGKSGVAGEVDDLRSDVRQVLAGLAAFTVDEFTNPPAADTDAIRLAAATVVTARTLSGADLDGVVGEAEMVPPRVLTATTAGATPANAPATAVVTGKVRNSKGVLETQTETIALSQIAATVTGTKAFSTVVSIAEAAGDGVAATVAYGFGAAMGLGKPLISRAGAAAVLAEIEAGTVLAADAVTGIFTAAAASSPHGLYSPANAANGARDYAVYYEYDPEG